MIGFTYLTPARRRGFVPRVTTIAIDNRIRGPIVALLATLALTAALSLVSIARLHAAQASYGIAASRLAAEDAALADVRALQAQLASDRRLTEHIAAVRRANLQHADVLVGIGNRLPAHTWLQTVRYEDGSYVLEGTAERSADVGAALITLRAADAALLPQLISLQRDAEPGKPGVHYRLRLATR